MPKNLKSSLAPSGKMVPSEVLSILHLKNNMLLEKSFSAFFFRSFSTGSVPEIEFRVVTTQLFWVSRDR